MAFLSRIGRGGGSPVAQGLGLNVNAAATGKFGGVNWEICPPSNSHSIGWRPVRISLSAQILKRKAMTETAFVM